MDLDHRKPSTQTDAIAQDHPATPGKHTLIQDLPPIQRQAPSDSAHSADKTTASPEAALPAQRANRDPLPTLQMIFGGPHTATATDDPAQVHAAAALGTASPATPLPSLDQIQRSFGRHDVSQVKTHVGGEAAASARAMGAQAYATGDHVVLGDQADLHTVAHEAAHVVQQRGGVHLKGGVGEVGDTYERHADAVADRVVSGGSAEHLLDEVAPAGAVSSRPGGVQMAGHTGVILYGTVKENDKDKDGKDKGILLKRVEQTEYNEYNSVKAKQDADDHGALATFPKVYGVYADLPTNPAGKYDPAKHKDFAAKHDAASRYIEIGSVKEHATDDVMDFKIGTSTTNASELTRHGHITGDTPAGASAKADKKVRRENIADSLTESGRFGLRDSDKMRTARGAGVLIGKKFNWSANFLSMKTLSDIQRKVERRPYPADAKVFIALREIENYIRDSDTVYLASSLVMNWSNGHTDDSIKLIDLAHPLKQREDETSDDGFHEAKNGMLLGIQNLRRILLGQVPQRGPAAAADASATVGVAPSGSTDEAAPPMTVRPPDEIAEVMPPQVRGSSAS